MGRLSELERERRVRVYSLWLSNLVGVLHGKIALVETLTSKEILSTEIFCTLGYCREESIHLLGKWMLRDARVGYRYHSSPCPERDTSLSSSGYHSRWEWSGHVVEPSPLRIKGICRGSALGQARPQVLVAYNGDLKLASSKGTLGYGTSRRTVPTVQHIYCYTVYL